MSASETRSAPTVAVITVTYRSDDVLPAFLASLPAASSRPLLTVVADNLPGAGRAAELARAAGAEYLPVEGNPGYGAAVNAAARTLPPQVEWILVANPDVVLDPGAIDALVETAASDPRIGSVGPRIRDAHGQHYPSARAVPSLRTGIGHALFTNIWGTNPWTRKYRADLAPPGERRDAGWLSGSCVLVRRSAFEELGGFDEGYFMYFEDVDLGYRLGKRGYRNIYEPAAGAVHSGAHATESESAAMIRAHHDSARRFIRRKYAAWWLWPVRVVVSAGLAMRSRLLERVRRRPPSPDSV